MNLTQNAKISQVKNETLVIGVDIASEVHFARAFDFRGLELAKVFRFENTEEGFAAFSKWAEAVSAGTQKTEIIVGAEPTGHYWFTFGQYLKEQSVKLVFVNPMHVKRTKELDDNNPGKTDRKDPKTIAKLVIDGRYLEPYMPEGIYAEMRTMNENRIRTDKELSKIINRVQRWLKIYFPEHKEAFGDWSCASSLTVLMRAPLPEDILKLGAEGINQLWREKKLRAVGSKRAGRLVEAAAKSVGLKEGMHAAKMEIEMLLDDFMRKSAQQEKIIGELERMCLEIPYAEKLIAIKGVGLKTVASFIAEAGDIRRFKSPKQIQKLAGLAIRENSSGKHKGKSTISKRGRKRLRHAMFQVILPMIQSNEEFRELHRYYTTRSGNPLKKMQSITALSCRLIRIFFVILKKGVDYDGQKLMQDIVRPQMQAAA
jgi:transposase